MVDSAPSHAAPSSHFHRWRRLTRPVEATFLTVGQWIYFTAQVIYLIPLTIRQYRRETLARMNSLAWGRGSLVVNGGVISVLVILGIAIGASIAIEAFATLNLL